MFAVFALYEANAHKNAPKPIDERMGIVKLSSNPKTSNASEKLATNPDTSAKAPIANFPSILASFIPNPNTSLTGSGNTNSPLYANPCTNSLPHAGTNPS
jgi:hypothetical protein